MKYQDFPLLRVDDHKGGGYRCLTILTKANKITMCAVLLLVFVCVSMFGHTHASEDTCTVSPWIVISFIVVLLIHFF